MTADRVILWIGALILTGALTGVYIPLMKRLKARQQILEYVTDHKKKAGTPTMGGVPFILVTAAIYFCFVRGSVLSTACVLIFLSYGAIGFLDDFIKIRLSRNEGLSPWQKIIFQTVVALSSSIFFYRMGTTFVYLPFTDRLVDLGLWFIPLSAFIFIAMTNCVNLTDGLDGLSASVSSVNLFSVAALIFLQTAKFPERYQDGNGFLSMAALAIILWGALSGFLIFNFPRASVFMGDTGSLALGGILAALMIFSGNALYVPIVGIMFVLSGISVILQVIYYKRTGKRIFLMAPLHHHFQMRGHAESKIVYLYTLVTLLGGLLSLLRYLP